MKSIVKQLKTILLLSLITGAVSVFVMGTLYYQFDRSNSRLKELSGLESAVFELTILSQDFLLTSSARAQRQCLIKISNIKSALNKTKLAGLNDGARSDHFNQIRENLDLLESNLVALFDTAIKNGNRDRKSQLSTSSLYLAQNISALMGQVKESYRDSLNSKNKQLLLLLTGFILLIKAFLIGTLFKLRRRFEESLRSLSIGIKQVSRGEGVDSIYLVASRNDEFTILLKEFEKASAAIKKRFNDLINELETQKAKAESASEAKSQFLANVSHEIRTPLSVIEGFTSLLQKEHNGNQKEYLAKIRWNLSYVLNLVSEILDLAKVESGKMKLHVKEFSLMELSPMLSSFKDKAEQKNICFSVESPRELPSVIETDKSKLEQILMNLLGNAIKFTDSGSISLKIEQELNEFRFLVSDTGCGISEEYQGSLFSAFFQGDTSLTNKTPGTGLGLALASKFSKLLGGALTLVESQLNRGSVFCAVIEVKSYSKDSFIAANNLLESKSTLAEKRTTKQINSKQERNVLVAEDNEDLRELMRIMLSSIGVDTIIVEDGKKAVNAYVQNPNCFDLVLLDIQMPEMDGYTAAKALRQLGYKGRLVAISARLMKKERQTGFEAGFDAYLEKPVSRSDLELLVTSSRNITHAPNPTGAELSP